MYFGSSKIAFMSLTGTNGQPYRSETLNLLRDTLAIDRTSMEIMPRLASLSRLIPMSQDTFCRRIELLRPIADRSNSDPFEHLGPPPNRHSYWLTCVSESGK